MTDSERVLPVILDSLVAGVAHARAPSPPVAHIFYHLTWFLPISYL